MRRRGLARSPSAASRWSRCCFRPPDLVVATVVAILYPSSAYVYLFGIALFGGLFVWMMIFITHLFFRRAWQARGGRVLAGTHDRLSVHFDPRRDSGGGHHRTTWWVPGMRPTIYSGLPWLVLITLIYFAWGRSRAARAATLAEAKLEL